jgi:hypothetical protein
MNDLKANNKWSLNNEWRARMHPIVRLVYRGNKQFGMHRNGHEQIAAVCDNRAILSHFKDC